MQQQDGVSSNRTFMELKHSRHTDSRGAAERSNRTFMELKQVNATTTTVAQFRSNRTFMELKREEYGAKLEEECVLIAPLWN